MRMSKDLAHRISIALTAKKEIELEKLKKTFAGQIQLDYEKTIPAIIKKAFKEHPNWINQTQRLYYVGAGFSGWNQIAFSKNLPEYNSEDRAFHLGESALYYRGMKDNIEKLDLDLKNLRIEIKNALINLSSFARIQKEFPEAVKYLPKSTSTAIAVNVDKIREKL